MKKLIAFILFFGSFGVAMAQSPNPYFNFTSNPDLRVAPSIPRMVPGLPGPTILKKTDNRCPSRQARTSDACPADRPNKGLRYRFITESAGDDTCLNAYRNRKSCLGSTSATPQIDGVDGYSGPSQVDNKGKTSTEAECIDIVCGKKVIPPKPKPTICPRGNAWTNIIWGGECPKPNNCWLIERQIKLLRMRLKPGSNDVYFDALNKEIEALTLKYNQCTGNLKCCSSIPYSGEPACRECGLRCLSSSSKIATPIGDIRVTDLKVGDIVWTTDAGGGRIVRPLAKASHVNALNHRVVNLVLVDGRTLDVSPLHPTAGGKTVGDLQVGDIYDGSTVQSAVVKPYEGTATYDILPAGDTGYYWANGILMGSTLK